MAFKDYYATLGLAPDAPQDAIKRAYRKLARRYHPDVSSLPDAEDRFKEVAEAHEALIDPERRAAYDDAAAQHARREDPAWAGGPEAGYEFSGPGGEGTRDDHERFSEFFESLFGADGPAPRSRGNGTRRPAAGSGRGADHHARVEISLEELLAGGRHSVRLKHLVQGEDGRPTMREREVEVQIPPGLRAGQHLRLAGMGAPGREGAAAGDLYLEIGLRPHPVYRVDGADLWFDLKVSPWEAALGARIELPTPTGEVQLQIPAASQGGRTLRLKGRGLPGTPPGDLRAVLRIDLPAADTPAAQAAYATMAAAFPAFDPRRAPASQGGA